MGGKPDLHSPVCCVPHVGGSKPLALACFSESLGWASTLDPAPADQAPCWGPRVEVSNSCSADWLNCWILTRQLSGGSLPGIQGLSPSGEQGLSLKSRAVGGHKVLSRSCSGCTHRGSLLHVCAPASLLLRGLMHWAEPCAAPLAGVTGGDAQLNAARWCLMWRGLQQPSRACTSHQEQTPAKASARSPTAPLAEPLSQGCGSDRAGESLAFQPAPGSLQAWLCTPSAVCCLGVAAVQ